MDHSAQNHKWFRPPTQNQRRRARHRLARPVRAFAERFAAGVHHAIEAAHLPWHVSRLGCRAEYVFLPHAPRNGGQAAAAMDFELERFMHLYALNRGILLTPFHNMALMSPATTSGDVDRHTQVFTAAVTELTQ